MFCSPASFAQQVYNVKAYGAVGDGQTLCTTAFQNAINAANQNGGGKVIVPAGYYLTGQLVLKSGVNLHLENKATLFGSTDRRDYDNKFPLALIAAKNEQNIAITGKGTINGQGRELVVSMLDMLRKGIITDPEWKLKRPTENNRPNVIKFVNSNNVKIKGVTIKDASGWVQTYANCTNVNIDSIRVESTAYWNNDGIDIVDCKKVKITNSFFNAADDAICLKSENAEGSCEDIDIENCITRSSASGFKIGTGSLGAFKRIKVDHLTVYDTYRSAIALETVDGAVMEDIDIRNVVATNTGNAIFIRLGHRNHTERYSTIQRVYIGNVKAEIPSGKPDLGYPLEGPLPKIPPHNLMPSSVTGLPGHPVKDIVMENIDITYGGGAQKQIAEVPLNNLSSVTENVPGYPEFTMFGELPAWGLYIRHAEGVTLKNIKLNYVQNDFRPVIVSDDLKGFKITGLSVPATVQPPVIVLQNTSGTAFEKLQMPANTDKGILVIK